MERVKREHKVRGREKSETKRRVLRQRKVEEEREEKNIKSQKYPFKNITCAYAKILLYRLNLEVERDKRTQSEREREESREKRETKRGYLRQINFEEERR